MTVSTASIARASASRSAPTTTQSHRPIRTTQLTWTIAALLALATPLTFAAAGPGVLPGDVAVANTLHGWFSGWFGGPIAFANILGRAPVAIAFSVVASALLFARRWFPEAALVASAGIAWVGNAALKTLAGSPRPTADLVSISENADGLGFPSGHVMGVTVLLGALLIIATTRIVSRPLRHLAQIATLTTLALSGVARIEVGAHWPSDVLGGYLWGAILLLTIVTVQAKWSSLASVTATVIARVPAVRRLAQVTESPS